MTDQVTKIEKSGSGLFEEMTGSCGRPFRFSSNASVCDCPFCRKRCVNPKSREKTRTGKDPVQRN
jgi:hypothetical protein